jgi:hypothetical protein
MELTLIRSYHPLGTNGVLFNGAQLVCRTIELPWKNNIQRISCIPEGRYELVERRSTKYGRHLMLKEVKGRSYILVHPANIAMKELKGCIAPVTEHTGPGRGTQSRIAMAKLQQLYNSCRKNGEAVFLNIRS